MAHVRFSNSPPLYDSDRDIVIFVAYVEQTTIRCAISGEALRDHFEKNTQKPCKTFLRNRVPIEHIAKRLILQQRFETDGSILIRTADC